MTNPFVPGFGVTPPVLVGRDELLGFINRAFGDRYDPHRSTWLAAPRGTGKTVLLNETQKLAGLAGWIVIEETARGGTGRLSERLTRELNRHLPHPPRRRFKGGSVSTPVGGASLELADVPAVQTPGLRETLLAVVELDSTNGVLITIDEIHAVPRSELVEFSHDLQLFIRSERPVAVVVAGLPGEDGDDMATFLRRCQKPVLDQLSDDAVRVGFQRTAAVEGGSFEARALELAVDAVGGYPYMLQLVGYWSWEFAGDTGRINRGAVEAALPQCERELTVAVLPHVDRELSAGERAFLTAMLVDDGPSRTADLAERLAKTPQGLSVTRSRLLKSGLLTAPAHGWVDFAIPGHRAQMRVRAMIDTSSEHVVSPGPSTRPAGGAADIRSPHPAGSGSP